MPKLRVVMTLGVLSHSATVRALGLKPSRFPFKHGAMTTLENGLVLADCYHVSRYNTNTGVLTTAMFEEVIAAIDRVIGRAPTG
jgi:uracil-DNA glycosylase